MYFALCLRIPKCAPIDIQKLTFRTKLKLSQEIFLKIKLRKFLQKSLTLEKTVISTPGVSIVDGIYGDYSDIEKFLILWVHLHCYFFFYTSNLQGLTIQQYKN